jgi:dTDP-4-dehydrorhamnose 3,5-epimerase
MDGVILTPLKRIFLEKGDVLHALKSTDSEFVGFGEAYFTQIKCGCTKGWKRHNKMTLNLVVIQGRVKFVVYNDVDGNFEEIILSPDENYQRLTLAPGLWMAFQGMGEGTSTILDIIPCPHDPMEADNKDISEINYFRL